MWRCRLASALVSGLCAQTPYPGGQSRQGRRRQPQNKVPDLETPVATFHGTLRSINKKEVVLELPEDQSIAFHISHKTKFLKDGKPVKSSAIAAGAPVTVDGKRDLLGNVEAVTVTVDSSKKPPADSKPPEPIENAAPPR